ncbi:MAG: slipin family protein [Candidatus Diapherotrites archaeon]|uniref:Slipin family protein n=1 Tax=Candidatus Iainarchaeum sp. TaxID=3101447 RepID=A0A8T4L6H9_9ARCH|nr:slipin family protein [Candidatus Diapherotrites archaeon]
MVHPAIGIVLVIVDLVFILVSIRVIMEYQRGVVFTFGKFTGNLSPGFNLVVPGVQRIAMVDLRVRVDDVPEQSPITKDNVSLKVDAVIYYKILEEKAQDAIIEVEDYRYAVSQLAQTTMRNVIGNMLLDEVLSKRDEVANKIREVVEVASGKWGVDVEAVKLRLIELPEEMKRVMARAAEAERIKRAAIIKASGEAQAAQIVSKAAETIASVEGGLNLRTIQGLQQISSDPSNEVVFFVPIDTIKPLEGYPEAKEGKK